MRFPWIGIYHVEEIVSVPGIGPVDLSLSLGVGPPGRRLAPETEAAIQTVLRACLAADVIYGLAEGPGERERRIDEGFRVLLVFGGRRPFPKRT